MKNKPTKKLTYAGICLALCLMLPFLTGQIPQIGSAVPYAHSCLTGRVSVRPLVGGGCGVYRAPFAVYPVWEAAHFFHRSRHVL